jgi:DNA replication licensing factor MCM6
MSSFLDGIFGSDAPASSAPGSSAAPRRTDRSSVRPGGPPSESAGANSDHEGFADDEIVGVRGTVRRPRGPPGDIPRVVDMPGEMLVGQFEEFLDMYAVFFIHLQPLLLTYKQVHGGSNTLRSSGIKRPGQPAVL